MTAWRKSLRVWQYFPLRHEAGLYAAFDFTSFPYWIWLKIYKQCSLQHEVLPSTLFHLPLWNSLAESRRRMYKLFYSPKMETVRYVKWAQMQDQVNRIYRTWDEALVRPVNNMLQYGFIQDFISISIEASNSEVLIYTKVENDYCYLCGYFLFFSIVFKMSKGEHKLLSINYKETKTLPKKYICSIWNTITSIHVYCYKRSHHLIWVKLYGWWNFLHSLTHIHMYTPTQRHICKFSESWSQNAWILSLSPFSTPPCSWNYNISEISTHFY